MRLVLLGGFLGAGKTTTMLAAAKRLGAAGRTVAVITNDQGDDLVDTRTSRDQLPAADVSEITGGCFCCRYDELAELLVRLAAAGTDVVFAEAVGSCTDLAATVLAPLRKFRPGAVDLAPLTVVLDATRLAELGTAGDDLGYLFDRQLAEADLVVLNKIDRLDEQELTAAEAVIGERCPAAVRSAISAVAGSGLPELLAAWLGEPAAAPRSIAVDYDRYAAAEASLGWLNQSWQLTGREPFVPGAWCSDVLERLGRGLGPDVLLGHAKVAVLSAAGLTKASLVSTRQSPRVDPGGDHVSVATAVLNVRAAVSPAALERAVAAAVIGALHGTVTSIAAPARAFAPAYPRPVHRIGSN